jgi:phosphonate transport system substrate-binding protein
MRNDATAPSHLTRRQALRTGAGLLGIGLLAACAAPAGLASAAELRPATPSLHGPAFQSDLNAMGWPTAIPTLTMGFIPLEDQVQQKAAMKPMTDHVSQQLGVPVEVSITTSYTALVEAQRNGFVVLSYHGPLSILFAEQQIGAVPILVDSRDGVNPASYNSHILAGKNSPVKTVQDVRGQDFTLVDPASASGNLFPRVMLLEEGIDPNKDIKARYAGNHQNAILAIAKDQVPCGASNNLSVDSAVSRALIEREDLVILKTSPNIPNGPFAVMPDLDPRAVAKIKEVFTQFKDEAVLKSMELAGPLVPCETSAYDFVRRSAAAIGLQFDESGKPLPVGG